MTRPGPRDPLALIPLLLLAVVAVLLFLPLLGLGRPPVEIIVVLLVVRLGLQIFRSRRVPELRRPGAWIIDLVLIVLLLGTR